VLTDRSRLIHQLQLLLLLRYQYWNAVVPQATVEREQQSLLEQVRLQGEAILRKSGAQQLENFGELNEFFGHRPSQQPRCQPPHAQHG